MPSAHRAAAAAAPACLDSAPDRSAALAEAARCRRRVEVMASRTEKGQLFVNPDRTLTSVQAARVQRVRNERGEWVAPDANLKRRADGSYAPAASSMDVAFSGGGSTWLATVRRGSADLALHWRSALPVPTVSGSTLTYAEVLPGVDLLVSADVDGFGELLEVKTPAAAANPELAQLRFRTVSHGLRVRRGEGNSLSVVDGSGATVFGSGTPTMWDSSGTGGKRFDGGMAGARVAPMPVTTTDSEIAVQPDRALLTAKTTAFPVRIDPALSAVAWTMINSRFPDQSYWSYDRNDCPPGYSGQCAKVGYTDSGQTMTYRSLFQFASSDYVGKHVLSATMSMDLLHSWSCGNTYTDAFVTNVGLTSGTTWRNSLPNWWGSASGSVLNSSCNDARKRSEWGLTGVAQLAAAQYWGGTVFGLKAGDESNHNAWKKFDAASARFTVNFNSYPNAPDELTVNNSACTTFGTRLYVRTLTPQLRAKLTDPDGLAQPLSGTFSWWESGAQPNGTDTATQGSIASGTPATVSIPAGRLVDGHTYQARARASDGIDTGQDSATCEFTVDATPPLTPASVSSTFYPSDGQPHGGAGQAGGFVFTPAASNPADVAGYAYTLDGGLQPEAAEQVTATATDHTATVNLTPLTDGTQTLRVWSKDTAGNYSAAPRTYAFGVRPGAGPDAVWRFEEGTGATTADGSEHGNPLTMTNVTWTAGRAGVGRAGLFAAGQSSVARTAGPVATKVPATGAATTVRTDASFTVSAWVRLDAAGGTAQQVVVSQAGSRSSAYTLGYSGPDNRWRFALAGSDVDSPAMAAVLSNAAPTLGRWTHLLGTYSTGDRLVRLMVDGVPQSATAAQPTPFNATGAVEIGRGQSAGIASGYFTGAIDDVRVYGRTMAATDVEVTAALKPTAPTVTFPAGSIGFTGKPMQITLDAHGDTSVTAIRYGLDDRAMPTTATLATPGGQTTVTVTPTSSGTKVFLAASVVGSAGWQSDPAVAIVSIRQGTGVSGLVLDGTAGTPVAGADVRLLPDNQVSTTAADGSYSFAGLAVGQYTLSVAGLGGCGQLATTDVSVDGPIVMNLTVRGASDRFGYTCAVQPKPFVPADTTVLPISGDDDKAEVALPFQAPIYGTPTSSLWVSTDGLLAYHDPAGGRPLWMNSGLPERTTPNAVIAPFWDDLVVDEQASVRATSSGTAPNRQFVIEWRNVTRYDEPSARLTFEVIIAESGAITFNYAGLDSDTERGSAASVGIESLGGTSGIQFAYRQAALTSGRAITFSYPAQPRPIPSYTVSGTVRRGGVPDADVEVSLAPSGMTTTTDAAGRYTFTGLEAGGVTVLAEENPGCDGAAVQADVQADATIDLSVGAYSKEGAYTCSVQSRAFQTLSGSPVPLNENIFGDFQGHAVSLPFAFPYYGASYSTVTVGSGGYLQFNAPGDTPLGAPTGYIDVYWDTTLIPDAQSGVRVAVTGTAPHRQVVIEWRDFVSTAYPAPFRVSFESILDEDGTITVNYKGIDTTQYPGGTQAEVSIEDTVGARKFNYTLGDGGIATNQAIVFQAVQR